MSSNQQRVGEVFAERLRIVREERGMSASQLAEAMVEAGFPRMSKAAVLQIETGGRKVTLEEALAFAAVLFAVPTQLLSPAEGFVKLTDGYAVDGEGMRAWLRFGDSFIASAGDLPPERIEDLQLRGIAIHARALLDAIVLRDNAGQKEALQGITDIFQNPEVPPAEIERREQS